MFKLATRYSLAKLSPVETARLRLAPLGPGDAEAVRALTDDPAITGAIDFLPSPFTLQAARGLIGPAKVRTDCFLGARTHAGALVAIVGLHLRGDHAVELGYWVGGGARGQGYGAEAVTAAIGLLRQRFPHRFLVAECRPDNAASRGLLLKVGFRDTGDEGHRPGRTIFAYEPKAD
ncbi:GCN5 family acetyltransferase [Methylobacterium sp. Leaf469]|uniref:GNAT family N-acetyltransferase n=1 Tax=unclassified Methylobacterium TaxID=2615210 RepID=UPI0006F803DC|nr:MULTISPECIES: GNAT family N-acetyltransferase [unclassified Methylobacterium]KQO70411.1 GCN5 family acetyltransferase [Methylobacterium sp. Leaf87]KQP67865.1 GCN5 family acetyltransferase [Methylobacterium sp. Leaf112]KQU02293.1 GCN5 family acetyltransferase [Methylobacterium sp. Leaf469]USU31850.1 GNAT family N-acetyltransferase [Methylobacterium sp. OTU13CASTA1]